jgi:hypothetical protein
LKVCCTPVYLLVCTLGLSACSGDSPSSPGTTSGGALVAPTLSSPADAAQLTTLRPTFVVTNATSGQSGAKTYEFQISERSDFAPSTPGTMAGYTVFATSAGVAEGTGGTTSYTVASDLQPATRMYWRSRVAQGTSTSDWSATRTFNTQLVGYSRAGELFDPLTGGVTIGTPVGSTVFVAGKGITLLDQNAYVRYQLAQTIANGEMSVEVQGLYANGPGEKMKIFSMMDGAANLLASKHNMSAQYRGLNGNPPNAISFKAVFGDEDFKLEPDFGQRSEAAQALNPSLVYYWKATWSNEFRLIVEEGRGGRRIYELGVSSRGSQYAPNPHMVFVGASNGVFNEEAASWPNATYRNFWVSANPRPATLGNAVN